MKMDLSKNTCGAWLRQHPAMRKIGSIGTILCLFLALLGCRQGPAADTGGLPDSSRIAALESLYGQGKEAVLEALEVTEDAEAQRPVRGMWNLKETAALQGVDFSQSLLYNADDETLYGIRYWYRTDDPDQAVQLAQGLLAEGRELYGEPTTYPGLSNLLSGESFAADFAAAMSDGSMADWKEEWAVGENTLCTLSVSVTGPGAATIFLDYSLAV